MTIINYQRPRIINSVILIGLAILTFGLVFLALTPPYSRDALIHHLAIPKLWIDKGGFYETPGAVFSYYPMNIEILYLLCLIIGTDILSKVIHLCFALGTGLIIYFYIKPKLGRTYSLLGMLIWISTPIVIYVGTIAYIDFGVTFFMMLAFFFFLRLMENESISLKKNIILFSLFTGLALGAKYTALITLPFFSGCLFIIESRKSGNVKALKYTAIYLFLSIFVASPWYFKNVYLTGNPIYPLSLPLSISDEQKEENANVKNSSSMSNEEDNARVELGGSTLLARRVLYSENIFQILAIPLRIFWQGKDNNSQYFDGVLNPIFLVFLPFFWFERKARKQLLVMFFFAWFFIFMVFFLQGMRIRYIIPAIPPLVILNVFGIRNIIQRRSIIVRSLVIVLLVFLIGMNFNYLWKRMDFVKPWRYLSSNETREQFLDRLVGSYRPINWINNNLPQDAKVLFILAGHRGYYCEREYRFYPNFGQGTLDMMVKSNNVEDLRRLCSQLRGTHLFTNHYLVFKYLRSYYSEEDIDKFRYNMNLISKQLYKEGPFSVLELQYDSPQKNTGHH